LENKFPENLELETNSGIVLVVGPNNSGKTALLRMITTSLDFRRYLKKMEYHIFGIIQQMEFKNPQKKFLES